MRTMPAAALVLGILTGCATAGGPAAPAIAVTSATFDDGGAIPVEHTCDGRDEPPPLSWEEPPAGTEEVLVVVDDSDAPGGVFVHWLVAGVAPAAAVLGDPLPGGAVEGRNDFGGIGWAGPCPPAGDDAHTYRFRVVAVDERTGLEPGFTAADLEAAVGDGPLAEGELTGSYGR